MSAEYKTNISGIVSKVVSEVLSNIDSYEVEKRLHIRYVTLKPSVFITLGMISELMEEKEIGDQSEEMHIHYISQMVKKYIPNMYHVFHGLPLIFTGTHDISSDMTFILWGRVCSKDEVKLRIAYLCREGIDVTYHGVNPSTLDNELEKQTSNGSQLLFNGVRHFETVLNGNLNFALTMDFTNLMTHPLFDHINYAMFGLSEENINIMKKIATDSDGFKDGQITPPNWLFSW